MSIFKLILFIVMILISLFLAYRFIIRRAHHISESALIYKTIASLAFIVLGFIAFWGSDGVSSMMILPGLVLGLVGDIYLDMKYVYPESDALYTFVGFGAFALGHIFYLIFLLSQYGLFTTGLIISIAVGVIATIIIYLSPNIIELNYGKFHVVASAYGGLLVFVTVYSAIVCFSHFTGARFLFFIGLLFFLFSDLILCSIYFGKDQHTAKNSVLNLSAYYLAQILIAASIFFI